jgi:hypothetical protein
MGTKRRAVFKDEPWRPALFRKMIERLKEMQAMATKLGPIGATMPIQFALSQTYVTIQRVVQQASSSVVIIPKPRKPTTKKKVQRSRAR